MKVVEATVAEAPGSPVPPAPAARFLGDTSDYLSLLTRGAILLALTLGLYRFWLATDVRRFLWSNTEVAGDTIEYIGTALELLTGFLIAIAILIPIYVLFFVAALNLGPVGQFTSLLGVPILAFLGQYAAYRARRYRLTRTVYRGVRCHQGGSALRYAVCALLWWSLIIASLGLAYPFAQARLERFKMRHTYYGNLRGRFEGSALRLFVRGFPMWILTVGPLAFALLFAIVVVDWQEVASAAARAGSGGEFINQLESTFPDVYVAIVVAIVAVAVSMLLTALLFPVFQAMMLRWWLSGLRFDSLIVRSRLRTGPIYGAYLRFFVFGLLFLIAVLLLGALLAGVGIAAVRPHLRPDSFETLGAAVAVVFYVVTMLGLTTIYQATVKLTLWRSGVDSIQLEGTAVLDHVKAEGTPSSALGEGLADALNVGGL